MAKIRLHIDPRGVDAKPTEREWGRISKRVLNPANIEEVTVQQLAQKIRTGHTICPAVLDGTKAADWREQQVFMVDIDNADTGQPQLTQEQALSICEGYGLTPVICYQTFSHSSQRPKFRLVFIMEDVVTDPNVRRMIVERLVSIFPQSDKACTNANRLFLGTNKEVVLFSKNARISVENILAIPNQEQPADGDTPKNIVSLELRRNPELEAQIEKFDFLSYLIERNSPYSESGNTVSFQNCEVCGHKNNLRYYKDTNTFYCFSSSGEVGGSIIDYLMATEGLTVGQAIDKFTNELCPTEWDTPELLEEYSLPSFPVRQLPSVLRDYVMAVSENTATAVDMPAIAALALVAAAVQGKFIIEGKSDYYEQLNLYFLIIAKSGERKSSIIKTMTKAIYQYEREENNRRKPMIAEEEAQLNRWRAQIEKYERKDLREEADNLRRECFALEQRRIRPLRLIADDTTPEALTSLMADNKGIITVISTEGGLFDIFNGKYSSNVVSIDPVLKAYTGDPIRVDRKGREAESIDTPALTMLLSAQESVLEGLLSNEAFRSRGLTGRILYSKPKSMMGYRSFDTPAIPETLSENYNQILLNLFALPYPDNGMPLIKLGDDALEFYREFSKEIEGRLLTDLEDMSDWGGKCAGAALRIAGLLHCVEHCAAPDKTLVSGRTMKRATKITRYFLKHAQYAYSVMGADKTLHEAKYILRRLEAQPKRELTKSGIYHLCRSKYFKKADDMLSALDLLIEYGYLKKRVYYQSTGGRPKGDGYLLNPLYFDR